LSTKLVETRVPSSGTDAGLGTNVGTDTGPRNAGHRPVLCALFLAAMAPATWGAVKEDPLQHAQPSKDCEPAPGRRWFVSNRLPKSLLFRKVLMTSMPGAHASTHHP